MHWTRGKIITDGVYVCLLRRRRRRRVTSTSRVIPDRRVAFNITRCRWCRWGGVRKEKTSYRPAGVSQKSLFVTIAVIIFIFYFSFFLFPYKTNSLFAAFVTCRRVRDRRRRAEEGNNNYYRTYDVITVPAGPSDGSLRSITCTTVVAAAVSISLPYARFIPRTVAANVPNNI